MSSKHESTPSRGGLSRGPLLAVRLSIGAAIAVSCYLAWISLSGSPGVGCGPDSGCQEVLNSSWAYVLGVPVSLIALAVYGAIFAGSFRLGPSVSPHEQLFTWKLLLPASVAVIGAALWFIGIQVLVIEKFCPYCLVTHGTASLAAVLLLISVPRQPAGSKSKGRSKKGTPTALAPATVRGLVLLALGGVGVMMAGQWYFPEKTYAERMLPGGTRVMQVDHSTRVVLLHGDKVQLNLNEVPVMGNKNAPNIMVSLHDYTCHGCRELHAPLKALHQAFPDELAIITLPMPLDKECNRLVPRTGTAHVNACKYAILGLAIWRAKPEAMEAYNDWIFAPERPPSMAQAYDFAKKLVGTDELEAALRDPWVKQQLDTDINLYVLNYQNLKNGRMPQTFIGTNSTFGSLKADALLRKVTTAFNLEMPPGGLVVPKTGAHP